MKNGFRQQATPSKKDQMKALQTELSNSQMALNITQSLVRQLIQNNQTMSQDLSKMYGMLTELQYKVLVLQDSSNLTKEALAEKLDAYRLKDFEEASVNEDIREGYTIGEEVKEDSVIILTSTAKDANGQDVGIFRSKVKLAETGVSELQAGLLGKKVGTKLDVTLNGVLHTVELLGIRQPRIEAVSEAAEDQVVQGNA